MGTLRFFFTDRFTRYDVAVIVLVSVFAGADELGPIEAVALIFGGFLLGAVGEGILKRREAARLARERGGFNG